MTGFAPRIPKAWFRRGGLTPRVVGASGELFIDCPVGQKPEEPIKRLTPGSLRVFVRLSPSWSWRQSNERAQVSRPQIESAGRIGRSRSEEIREPIRGWNVFVVRTHGEIRGTEGGPNCYISQPGRSHPRVLTNSGCYGVHNRLQSELNVVLIFNPMRQP